MMRGLTNFKFTPHNFRPPLTFQIMETNVYDIIPFSPKSVSVKGHSVAASQNENQHQGEVQMADISDLQNWSCIS